jgi:hypothetical protein
MTQFLTAVVLAILLRIFVRPLMDKAGFTKLLQAWRTYWITGIGIGVHLMAGPMLLALLADNLHRPIDE